MIKNFVSRSVFQRLLIAVITLSRGAADVKCAGRPLMRQLDWHQVNANGFGDSSNIATLWNNATAVHQGRILIGTWNYATGGELWQSAR
jgi:hypothetical protein